MDLVVGRRREKLRNTPLSKWLAFKTFRVPFSQERVISLRVLWYYLDLYIGKEGTDHGTW